MEERKLEYLVSAFTGLKQHDKVLLGRCPFCESRALAVFTETQQYRCYSCGAGGDANDFLMRINDCSFGELMGAVAPVNEKVQRIIEVNAAASQFFYLKGRKSNVARTYFRERKISSETIKEFCLGISGGYGDELYRHLLAKGFSEEEISSAGLIGTQDSVRYDKYWDRIIIPIFNIKGEVIGFGARALGDKKPKYLNSPETAAFDKSDELFGLHIAKQQGKPLILCEGYFDVISMHQAGFKTAVASLGTALTTTQCKILKEYTKKVFIAYDTDEAGIKAAVRAISMLEAIGVSTVVVNAGDFKDVDELLKSENGVSLMKEKIREGKRGKAFLAERCREQGDYKTLLDLIL